MGLFDSVTNALSAINPIKNTQRVWDGITGGQVTRTLNGLMGGGNDPTYTPPSLDPKTKGLIDERRNEAQNLSAQDFANRYTQGIDLPRETLGGTEIENQNTSLGMSPDPGMTAAINKKTSKIFDKNLGQLKQTAELQGMTEKHRRINEAANMKVDIANLKRGIDTRVAQYQTEAQATRYAVLNGVLGGAGSMAGVMAGASQGGNPMTGATPMATPSYSSGAFRGPGLVS